MAPPPPADARRLAWHVLTAVEQGAFADAALSESLRATPLAARDRALATQLVYGTLAWQGLLDRAIVQGGRDPRRLDEPIRTLLRLALFQLVRLDRVPEFAAVDTAVELSKEIKRGAASGLVNALLRRFLREGKQIAVPPRHKDPAAHLAAVCSHPRWLVERWLAELGETQTEALLTANNGVAATVLRANRRRNDRAQLAALLAADGVVARPGSYADDALIVDAHGDLVALPAYRDGRFALQGEASQLVVAMLGAREQARVLDVCAAPGGKATAAAERLDGGLVIALDRQARGIRLARRSARRLGLRNLCAVQADATALPLADGYRADAVLVDAPCSGLGTLRQHPEIRWRRTADDVRELAAVQRDILHSAARHVAPGGTLVYATCTIVAAENTEVISAFLAAQPQFTVVDPRPDLPAAAHPLIDANHFLRTYPHRHGLDGFFAARLRRSPDAAR